MDYSPILSIITATLETAAAVWAFCARGRKSILRTSAVILLLLAGYQVIETVLCSNPQGLRVFGRIAFMVVLWLPPTGILLLTLLAGSEKKWLRWLTTAYYALALGLFIWLLVDPTPIGQTVCQVVFAKYDQAMSFTLNLFYGIYYQLGLILMLFISAILAVRLDDHFQRKLVGQVLFGTLAFIIPTFIVINFFPITEGAFSSILCHFALLLAAFLARLTWLEHKRSQFSKS